MGSSGCWRPRCAGDEIDVVCAGQPPVGRAVPAALRSGERRLDRAHTTVDHNLGAVDEGAFVRGQEEGCVGEFFR
jgi:hypothetical protein